MSSKQNNKVKSWLKDKAWMGIFIAILTILLGIILNEVQLKIGWLLLLTSLGAILIIFSVVIWLIVKYVFSVSSELVKDFNATLETYIGPDKIKWIMTTPQMVEFEKNIKVPEIWLISSDLAEDAIGKPFQNTVSDNLVKRNIKYRYFVPNRNDIKSKVEQLIRYNKNSKNLEFFYLNDDFYFLAPKFDFAIYNPLKQNNTERVAYMGIPIEENEIRYHAKVSDDFIDNLMGKLLKLMEEKKNRG